MPFDTGGTRCWEKARAVQTANSKPNRASADMRQLNITRARM